MKDYIAYMDRVALTPEEHNALLSALTQAKAAPKSKKFYVNRYMGLAACCALILAGIWGLGRLPGPAATLDPVPPTVDPSTVTAAPNAKVYDAPADPDADWHANTDPGLASQPPALVLPHVETPAPTDAVTDYILPSQRPEQGVFSHPIEVDETPAAPPSTALTLGGCRSHETLGQHVPAQVPGRFSFDSGSGADDGSSLSVLWTHGMEEIHVSLTRPETAPETMDPNLPARYDVRLYTAPWCDSVPEDILFGGFQDPVFRFEDLTGEIIAARGLSVSDSGDTEGLRFTFSVLYSDGVVARYSLKGLTAEEAAALVLE